MSELTIWKNLRSRGFSEKAVAALMGNMREESDCFAPRVQGDFTSGYTKSILYTSQVDDGIIGRNDFIHHGPGGGGYGLCQWTYFSRKQGLYDLAQRSRRSIGDEDLQLEWLCEELKQGEYSSVLSTLQSDTSLEAMVASVLRKFERPADQSDSALGRRLRHAKEILNAYSGVEADTSPSETEPDEPVIIDPQPAETCTTVHRVLCMGDLGRDVVMLQAGLVDMGYDVGSYGIDGAFGNCTYQALRKMQADCNLTENGTAGEQTWAILFQ